MPFTTDTLARTAFKRLQGLAHTTNDKDPTNESEASQLTIAANEIFAETIPVDPNSAVSSGIAAFVTLDLTLDNSSNGKAYFASIGTVAGSGLDGYVNPRTGVNYADSDRVGYLIPLQFGSGYRAILFNNSVEVPPLSSEDWFFDYRSGIVTSEDDLSLTNGTIDGYVYIGNFVSDSLGSGGGVSASGTPVNNQLAIWTNASTIEGDSNLTWDGSDFVVDGAAVFNESGNSVDFRVEGSNDSNLFFVDASEDRVGVGTNTPESVFHVSDGNVIAAALSSSSDRGLLSMEGSAPHRLSLVRATSAAAGNSGTIRMLRARNTLSSPSAVQDDDRMFALVGGGYDGTGVEQTVAIDFWVDGTVSAGNIPGRISFDTSSSDQASRQERMRITSQGSIWINEIATPDTPDSGFGAIYFKSDGNLYQLDDAGVETLLSDGDVSASGTPVNNQLAIWTNASTIEGDSNLTWDGSDLVVDGAAVFNESGNSVDFRVEGSNDSNLFFVDASEDRVGVGTNTPESVFHVSDGNAIAAALSSSSDRGLLSMEGTAPHRLSLIRATSAAAGNSGTIRLLRARNTLSSPSAVQDDDRMFALVGGGYDGTGVEQTVAIDFWVDGAVSAGNIPGRISFDTSSSDQASRQERMRITSQGSIWINEIATPDTPASGFGAIYFKSDGNLYQLDDAGVETLLSSGGVSASGTPVNNQLAIWTNASTIEGDSNLTWDGSDLVVDGAAVFNESGNSVDFRVEGSTDSNLLFVDASANNVGIGTSTPGVKLSVEDSAAGAVGRFTSTASSSSINGCFIHIEQNDGAAISSGDRIGGIIFRSTLNSTPDLVNAAAIVGFADDTWTGSSSPARIEFETTPSSSTTRVSRMTIDSTGFVGIGTSSPEALLHLSGSSPFLEIANTAETASGILMYDSIAKSTQFGQIDFNSGPSNQMSFYVNNTSSPVIALEDNTSGTGARVGINTADPDRIFHVASETSSTTGSFIRLSNENTASLASHVLGTIEFETGDASDPGVACMIEVGFTTSTGDTEMRFYTGDATNMAERFTIGSSGGIATARGGSVNPAPTSAADFRAGVNAGSRGLVQLRSNTAPAGTAREMSLLFMEDYNGGDHYLWVDDSSSPGRLRINTSNPNTGANDTTGTVVGTQTFTGFHFYPSDAIVDLTHDDGYDGYLAVGDVVRLVDGYIIRSSIAEQKDVVGIFAGFTNSYQCSISGECSFPPLYYDPEDGYYDGYAPHLANILIREGKTVTRAVIASLGDTVDFDVNNQLRGFNVCNEGGAVSSGDLLCSSSIPGYLMKQSDDIMRSYTVGKALEDVTFDGDGKATEVYGYIYCG